MRLVITQNITVDGVIDMSEGWADPDPEDGSSDVLSALRGFMAQESAQL